MRAMAILVLAAVLGAGLGISYLVYRQLETKAVMLEATPQLARDERGALCGNVDLVLESRTLGRWRLRVEEGQAVSGVVAVDGEERLDVGVRIPSPNNRLVFFEAERQHRQPFELSETIRGDYTFELDNRHSVLTDKRVRVSVCVV